MKSAGLTARCHCGAVEIVLPRKPSVLTACTCSYCRQFDPLFAYYRLRTIELRLRGDDALASYAWGHGVLRWFRCAGCGAFTHHAPVRVTGPEVRLGINLRLVSPDILKGTMVNLRDGADNSWRLLESYRL